MQTIIAGRLLNNVAANSPKNNQPNQKGLVFVTLIPFFHALKIKR
jgi:hypothetical protein